MPQIETTQVVAPPRRPPGVDLTFSAFSTIPTTPTNTTNNKHPLNLTSPTLTLKSSHSATSPFSAMLSAKFVPATGVPRTPGMNSKSVNGNLSKTPSGAAFSGVHNVKTPLSASFEQVFVVDPESTTVDSDGVLNDGDRLLAYPEDEFECELEPPLLTNRALRIVPLPSPSPGLSGVDMSFWTRELGGQDYDDDFGLQEGDSDELYSKGYFESEHAPLSPLRWGFEGEDVNPDPVSSGWHRYDKFWMDTVGSVDVDSPSSSSCSSSSDDDTDVSESDSTYARSGSPLEFLDLGAWCRDTTASPPSSSFLFGYSAPAVEADSALTALFSKLTSAIPVELHDALKEGVKLEYNAWGGKLAIIIGEKQDDDSFKNCEESARSLKFGIHTLSVSVVHSLGSLVAREEPTAQFRLLLHILSWAQTEWRTTLEELSLELPEAFVLPKDSLKGIAAPKPIQHSDDSDASALHTLTWTGDLQFLSEILRGCFSPQTLKGIQALKVNSEISVDDALLLLGRFEGLESGIRSIEIVGAGVGGCEPVLLPEYLESEVPTENGQVGLTESSASPSSKKVSLPYLDTLRINASVSLAAFFAAVDLPRLCELELDLGDKRDGDAAEDTLYALFGTVLMPSSPEGEGGLLYLDVKHGGTYEIGERMRGLVVQQDPDAYVVINGERN
ncbi:hypothetical protein M413DRAFT_26757 [Hebeloma cylindrosporum]|uniref:Uncharacterized protein n=1 Tax=Hebeloma cylindrosporum TaxID=76867 RepID=A0A0C3CEX9_HEBCY|nr:hypothetical protein M413DRAFT_26757 [Hebeloma cylindrosporum h7]